MNQTMLANPASPSGLPPTRLARRSSKLNLAGKIRVCDVVAMGGTLKMAAEAIGCSERAIHKAAARDSGFREKLRTCRTEPKFSSIQTMNDAAKNVKNWRAAYYLMQRLYPARRASSADVVPVGELHQLMDNFEAAVNSAPISDDAREHIERRFDKAIGRLQRRNDDLFD